MSEELERDQAIEKEEVKEEEEQHVNDGSVLKVKGDGQDVSTEERAKRVKNLAGAIAHGIRNHGEVTLRAFGPVAVYKAVKAIIQARGIVATQGYDLYPVPAYITAVMGGKEKTGIKFICFISKNN